MILVIVFLMHEKSRSLFRRGTLRQKCPYSEFFWSVFSRIQTEYGELRSISPYSVQMWENTDQKNSEYGHFSSNGKLNKFPINPHNSNS